MVTPKLPERSLSRIGPAAARVRTTPLAVSNTTATGARRASAICRASENSAVRTSMAPRTACASLAEANRGKANANRIPATVMATMTSSSVKPRLTDGRMPYEALDDDAVRHHFAGDVSISPNSINPC